MMRVLIVVLVVATLALAVIGCIAYFVQLLNEDHVAQAVRDTGLDTEDAALAPDPDPQVPARAPLEPALRVHLCTSCGTHGVPRPGEWCMPCVYRTSPVHRAEEILAEAAGKADAS